MSFLPKLPGPHDTPFAAPFMGRSDCGIGHRLYHLQIARLFHRTEKIDGSN